MEQNGNKGKLLESMLEDNFLKGLAEQMDKSDHAIYEQAYRARRSGGQRRQGEVYKNLQERFENGEDGQEEGLCL